MISTRPDDFATLGRERAKPLAPDERRAAIIAAVIPLISEHGRAVSTRQLAEAAGVAEGTLFRAFGDKDSLIQAAIDQHLDPEPLREALRGIDPGESTEAKVHRVLQLLAARFESIIAFMAAVGMHGPPPGRPDAPPDEWVEIVSRLFRDDEIAVPTATLAFYLRLLAFSSAIPRFNQPHAFSTAELTTLVVHGIAPSSQKEH